MLAHTTPPGVNILAHTVNGVTVTIPALDADLTQIVYYDEIQPVYALSLKPAMNTFTGGLCFVLHCPFACVCVCRVRLCMFFYVLSMHCLIMVHK